MSPQRHAPDLHGHPDFAVPALEALAAAGHEIACVYTQPPRPGGRGQRPRPSPVAMRAAALGAEVRRPASLREAAEQEAFAAVGAEVAVVVAYGLILPPAVLGGDGAGVPQHPRLAAAALARGGADPAGDHGRGRGDRGLDHGDGGGARHRAGAARARRCRSGRATPRAALQARLAALGARLIVEALGGLDRLAPAPQPEAGVTYAAKIDKAEARVDWARPAAEVDRLIRGLVAVPGGLVRDRRRAGEAAAERAAEGAGAPGTVLDDRLAVACGEGAVRLLALQRAGRRRAGGGGRSCAGGRWRRGSGSVDSPAPAGRVCLALR